MIVFLDFDLDWCKLHEFGIVVLVLLLLVFFDSKPAYTGASYGPPPPPQVLDLKEPRRPISLTSLFEVVADDLLTLNRNLKSVSARSK